MSQIRDERNAVVVDVHPTATGISAKFWLLGLEFDLTDCLRIFGNSNRSLDFCMEDVRRQVKAYTESKDVMERRAGHMLHPTPSAPLHRDVGARTMQTLNLYRKYQQN